MNCYLDAAVWSFDRRRVPLTLILLLCLVLPRARGEQESPQVRLHYAPDRDYDLQHVSVDLIIDYEKHSFRGSVVNTLAPLRDGLTTIWFDCGENLTVSAWCCFRNVV
jgi:hypothetical protein